MDELIRDIKNKITTDMVVSFDIFDTLLLRPFAYPSDLFGYIEEKHCAPGFKSNRVSAERRSRHGKTEISIDDIYLEIKDEYQVLKDIELQAELDLSFPNKDVVDLFNYAVNKAKEVIIISDMYLPEVFLARLLSKNGIKGYKKIYVSSEYKARKNDGKLFEKVLQEKDLKPINMIHIGDNLISDFSMPKRKGICSFCVTRSEDIYLEQYKYRRKNLASWQGSVLVKVCSMVSSQMNENYWTNIGYQLIGPLCFSFCKWIIQSIDTENMCDVCFVARDGYLLKKCYELLTGKKAKYVYAPRHVMKKVAEGTSKDELQDYVEYVESLGLSKNIFLVDSRTSNFSSQRLLQDVSRSTVRGLYYINSNEDETLEYSSFHIGNNNSILSWNFVEYFLSAPTPSVIGIVGGNPQYAKITKEEDQRQKNFAMVEHGVMQFVSDMEKVFPQMEIPETIISDWINSFIQNPSKEDVEHFSEITFANDALHNNYVMLNPFLTKGTKQKYDYREMLMRFLILHPNLYAITRALYRKLKKYE